MNKNNKPKPGVEKSTVDPKIREAARKVKLYGGYCCPVMHLVLSRLNPNSRVGMQTATMFTPFGKKLKPRNAVVINFPKAKKDDTGIYGHGKEFGNSTWAECDFCPFCGEPITETGKAKRRRLVLNRRAENMARAREKRDAEAASTKSSS